ncbi:MAG TPA: ATP-binding protein [Gammaproteobacteria bacterium]|nr:ATP-binding protein [Gammaproteobacteria bacterium]
MSEAAPLFLGVNPAGEVVQQLPRQGNRHGLIAGATGTGKTITLQVLAEGFSALGVPVLAADIKGDLCGIGAVARPHPKIDERLARMPGLAYTPRAVPLALWDLYGETGIPIRATVSELGPLLLTHLLELNDTQSGVLYAAFKVADDQGLLLLDLEDLRSLLSFVADNAKSLRDYGHITGASVAAIQRGLLVLAEQGGDRFFGEPALALDDLLHRDAAGFGVVNLLDATRLINQSPRLYACFLLWLMAELFEQLPEVGDPEVPRLVIFFDEAHLLFSQASKTLIERIEQVVRLIRSKGVGVYFVTQDPSDVPDAVLGQLGLRVQHALRAFTPRDRRTILATADNFRPNPDFSTAEVLTTLATGEALISSLDAKGSPCPVERTLIRPPSSRIGPLTAAEREAVLGASPMVRRYRDTIDRDSAHEELRRRADALMVSESEADAAPAGEQATARSGSGNQRQTLLEAMTKSFARSVGSALGRKILRGVMGALLGGRR